MARTSTTTEQHPTHPTGRAPARRDHAATVGDLRRTAAQLGQVDVGDPRWTWLEPALDTCLRTAARCSPDPRASVWRAIVDDADSPLVVKLRTVGVAVASLDGCDPKDPVPATWPLISGGHP